MTPPLVILILSLLLGMQPLTSDLYLPALPALTDSLGTTLPRAQLSLTALLLSFGVINSRFGLRGRVLIFRCGGFLPVQLCPWCCEVTDVGSKFRIMPVSC